MNLKMGHFVVLQMEVAETNRLKSSFTSKIIFSAHEHFQNVHTWDIW